MEKKKKTERKMKEKEKEIIEKTNCTDPTCPIHGRLKTRGRFFEGIVTKKFPKRITIEFERMTKIRKYERFARYKTRIHARLPACLEKEINIGDLIKVQECRPLSKIIHFVVIKKIKDASEIAGGNELK
jgi:small subunit ribosomal protein S17